MEGATQNHNSHDGLADQLKTLARRRARHTINVLKMGEQHHHRECVRDAEHVYLAVEQELSFAGVGLPDEHTHAHTRACRQGD